MITNLIPILYSIFKTLPVTSLCVALIHSYNAQFIILWGILVYCRKFIDCVHCYSVVYILQCAIILFIYAFPCPVCFCVNLYCIPVK